MIKIEENERNDEPNGEPFIERSSRKKLTGKAAFFLESGEMSGADGAWLSLSER
jgi:hypothetical protein